MNAGVKMVHFHRRFQAEFRVKFRRGGIDKLCVSNMFGIVAFRNNPIFATLNLPPNFTLQSYFYGVISDR